MVLGMYITFGICFFGMLGTIIWFSYSDKKRNIENIEKLSLLAESCMRHLNSKDALSKVQVDARAAFLDSSVKMLEDELARVEPVKKDDTVNTTHITLADGRVIEIGKEWELL
jgi:hypothetical protein